MNPDFPQALNNLQFQLLQKLNLNISNLTKDEERSKYSAYQFELDNRKIIFRSANVTPKKVGQFVAIWKRNNEGLTHPYAVSDSFDFIIIYTELEDHFGHFIFPKSVLLEQKIISSKSIIGKRGFRVYPSWDAPNNKQAFQSQKWQLNYFLDTSNLHFLDLERAKKLYVL